MTTTSVRWPSLDEVADSIAAVIDRSEHIGVLAHKDADADSLGSALAFALTLRDRGKRVHAMVPEPLPYTIDYLRGFELLEEPPPQLDALFTFDCATVARFGEKGVLIDPAERAVVNVDHHATNEGFGSINLVDPRASATGQVVYDLLTRLNIPVSADAATNLYAALFTDTGGFRHENTTETALRLGAELVRLGADPGWVALKSYKSRTVPQLRLEALAVATLTAELDGRLIWSAVSQEMLERAGADMQLSEGVIDTLQSVDTMQLAVLFKEVGPERTKISVRSRNPIDATEVCKPFGGGGHHRAAGAELPHSLAETQALVLPVARTLVEPSR